MSVDYEHDLLLITAASGKQSTGLLPHLRQWKRLRLQVASEASRERLQKEYPNAEVVQAHMSDHQACRKLLEGVAYCFLITPAFQPHETESGYNIIDAAVQQLPEHGGNFMHLVYSSVLHPIKRALINHDCKRYVEEYLTESKLPYTIVQPTQLMENLPLAKLASEDQPVHRMPWSPDTPFSLVSCLDLGQAVANILSDSKKHRYATYQIVGTEQPLNFHEAMRIMSEELGREVKIEQITFEAGAKFFVGMLTRGQPENASFENWQGPARMFLYYNDKGLLGNPNVLEMLLGRKPLSYRGWVKESLKHVKR
ncbi:hypothetical protein BAUCODRAFT_34010 [Baudoinia panamericana UAMH 10762]|uniref:NmrA-like domain-containing protein n=1 Tax=Baudoinia panamericana (strain UAMH 10762) TaxID=717646 RepID=M2NCL4_BAUPA|nr:uncharacterized protein BAUCODRAFT_34010 [Baudoinia panamericana UAMH 10762]EMC96635.1 hypothetical protein BAUCODRAFT_34010 [Baudoinia panamericana UAMH 10762]